MATPTNLKAFVDEQIKSIGKNNAAADGLSLKVPGPGDMASKDELSKSPEPEAPPGESDKSPELTRPVESGPTRTEINTKRWKVGYACWNATRDGCFIYVGPALTNRPGPRARPHPMLTSVSL